MGDIFTTFALTNAHTKMINDVLQRNKDEAAHWWLWHVDDHSSLPDFPGHAVDGTHALVEETWRSLFIETSVEDAAEDLRSVPEPKKPLCKTYFAVLDRQRYEENDQIMIYNMVGDEVQGVPCTAGWAGEWRTGHERDTWEERYRGWTLAGETL